MIGQERSSPQKINEENGNTMADSILIFDLNDTAGGDTESRMFRAENVDPKAFLLGVANSDGAFIDYIEESSRELGDIVQKGSEDENGIRWTLSSSEMENPELFIEDVVASMFALFGWTLTEID